MPRSCVLVLGGSGYLGGKIVARLIEQGKRVICTKRNLATAGSENPYGGQPVWIPASREGVYSALRFTNIDCVLNLACNYGRGQESDSNIIRANTAYPLEVFETVMDFGVDRFITVGTSLPEDLNVYSFSKSMFNRFGAFYANKRGLDFLVAKLEMYYGADEPENRFLPGLVRNMCAGRTVRTTIGTQKRDVIHVNDAVTAITTIMDCGLHGYQEIPVGTGIAPSVAELTEYIWKLTGKKSRWEKGIVPMREREPDSVADTTELNKLCNWEPTYWKVGISDMVKRISEQIY